MEYCKCKHRTPNSKGLIFVEGNYGYCEKCEKHVSPKRIIKIFGSSLPIKMSKKRLWGNRI